MTQLVVLYDCPLCDRQHEVTIITSKAKARVKERIVEYMETKYFCPNSQYDEKYFVPSNVMDENNQRVRDAYRKEMNLLTSSEIKAIRDKYSLTQKEMSNLLGWGDVTIQRYEKKMIQDETYDLIIRRLDQEPLFAIEQLKLHRDKFDERRFNELVQGIKNKIRKEDNYFYKYREIYNSYTLYDTESDYNGYKLLDIKKVEQIIAYIYKHFPSLYKVKLMKLLWYSDVLHYKENRQSITGLVYTHLPLGAVPIAHEEILHLPSIKVEEDYFEDNIGYKIISNVEPNESSFKSSEINTLNKVINYFNKMNTSDIVKYMHDEIAYKETEKDDIIPYSLGLKIKDF